MASEAGKGRQKRDGKKRKKPVAKSIRDQAVIEKAMEGKSGAEIAEEVGICRQTVSEILNSAEVEDLLKQGEDRIRRLASKAIDALEYAIDERTNFAPGAVANGIRAAIPILKTMGLLKEAIDVSHQFPKPMVIEFQDGKRLILGSEHDVKAPHIPDPEEESE